MATNPNPTQKKNILAGLSVPTSVTDAALRRFLQAIKQHIELGHGNKGQPLARFVTVDELKLAGLIDVGIRGNRAVIADKARGADVVQEVVAAHEQAIATIEGLQLLLDALESTDEDLDERVEALELEELATYAVRIDEVGSIIYVGNAAPGALESGAVWRIQRITFTTAGEADADIEWADGNSAFDNIWDDRATLSYS